jgi:arylsulfatase
MKFRQLPFDRWPSGKGFEHFYGWHLGHTEQYHPNLYEDNSVIDIEPNTKHLSTLLADKAIKYIANQKSLAPDKPFFCTLPQEQFTHRTK